MTYFMFATLWKEIGIQEKPFHCLSDHYNTNGSIENQFIKH